MDESKIWTQFKTAWKAGRSPSMDESTFCQLFQDEPRAVEALDLIDSSPAARETLSTVCAVSILVGRVWGHPRVIWEKLQNRNTIARFIRDGRRDIEGVKDRSKSISCVAKFAIEQFGRKWVRENLIHWWQGGQFVEEEEEELLKTLAENGVLNAAVVHELGSSALAVLQRLVGREVLDPKHLIGVRITDSSRVQGRQAGNELGIRVSALMQPVSLELDIQSAWLRPDESPPPEGFGRVVSAGLGPSFAHGIQRLRRLGFPEMREFADTIEELFKQASQSRLADSRQPCIQFPLIRFLHLRKLLSTPSLGGALSSPEQYLAADILLSALGDDSVSYSPEIRIHRDTERRWRANWAESSGEALSVLFLECTVGLDLTTLVRIPETARETPDFMAQSSTGEPIVFESKGATSWKVHRDQRNKARSQVHGSRSKSRKATQPTWAGNGRAFALCLFAARSGDSRRSLFYAEDPPFPFEDVFREGWVERSRRAHFAGVLEAAQLFEAADGLRAGRPFSVEQENIEVFSIGPIDTYADYSDRYVGTYLPVLDVARRLRHPNLLAASQMRIFVGVHEQVLDELRQGELPRLGMQASGDAAQPGVPRFGGQAWGYLPGHERGGPARGVYSTLADGSFLAVELQ